MPAVVSGQLVATAPILVAFVITAFAIFVLWIVSLLLLAVAAYLMVWATRGKGMWCRHCKNFPVFKQGDPRG